MRGPRPRRRGCGCAARPIALENRARRRTRRDDHAGALADLERALDGALGPTKEASPGEPSACSFCAKTQREVKKLVAETRALLCDECLGLCNDSHEENARHRVPGVHVFPDGMTCSSCDTNEGRQLVTGPEGIAICDDCVDRANAVIASEVESG